MPHLWLHCGNKSVSIGLLLVLCTYDLFSATGLVPRPPVLWEWPPFLNPENMHEHFLVIPHEMQICKCIIHCSNLNN